jgi:hypothetical protein
MLEIESSKTNGKGWEAFIKNDWTEWAESNGIILENQFITPKLKNKKSGKRISFATRTIKDNKNYLPSPLQEWYKQKSEDSTYWTINEYKKLFGKRPDWVNTFRQRGLDIDGSGERKSIALSDEDRTVQRWKVERELVRTHKVKSFNVAVERALNVSGQCKEVTLIFIPTSSYAGIIRFFRYERWIAKGLWQSTPKTWIDDKDKHIDYQRVNYSKLLKLPKPWITYLNPNVAQS